MTVSLRLEISYLFEYSKLRNQECNVQCKHYNSQPSVCAQENRDEQCCCTDPRYAKLGGVRSPAAAETIHHGIVIARAEQDSGAQGKKENVAAGCVCDDNGSLASGAAEDGEELLWESGG